MYNGVIKKKNEEKGYGFITQEGEAQDLFFHKDGLVGVTFEEIKEGDKVTFDSEASPKGKKAVNVNKA